MSDNLEQSIPDTSPVADAGASEGITLSEGAEQLVNERTHTPSESPPEVLDYLDTRGERTQEAKTAREAADDLARMREQRLQGLQHQEKLSDRGQIDDMHSAMGLQQQQG
jgi:hypothetical protein